MRDSHRILQENAGNRRNMEAVFRPEIVRIFSGRLLRISCAFLQELAGNDRKKSEKFPAGILLPCSSDFRCFPAGTGPYFLTWVPLLDLPHLREFSDENYRKTLQLTIPDDDRMIPSFYYMPPAFSGKPIAVEYMLKVGVKTHGFFKDFILNIPIFLHSMEMYMQAPNEEEAAPPSYDFAIATH
jgi:hypothetical protein